MRCNEFDERLNDLLDDRRDPLDDASLMQHAANCPQCSYQLESWIQVEATLLSTTLPGSVDRETSSSALQSRVMPVITTAECPPSTPAAHPWLGGFPIRIPAPWLGLALAAGLLGMMIGPESMRRPTPALPETEQASLNVKLGGLDLHRISLQVTQPDWWGSIAVSALRPVDPLKEGIRPLTESLQSALELLSPHTLLGNEPNVTIAPEDSSASRGELLASVV